jgi:hypothetical protein
LLTTVKIAIDHLTEEELIDLNHRIVERLRLLHQMRAHMKMLEFRIGERVEFQPENHPKKTVSIVSDSGQRWTVSPGFLRRAGTGEEQRPEARDMIWFPQR